MDLPEARPSDAVPVEPSSKVTRSTWFAEGKENRLRRWVAKVVKGALAPPYLPGLLTLFGLLLALSTGIFILMQQHPEYWTARKNIFILDDSFTGLLSAGPLVYLAIVLGYLLVLALALMLLNRRAARIVWVVANLLHLSLIGALSGCGFRGIFEGEAAPFCANVSTHTWLGLSLIFGLSLSGALALLRADAQDPPARRMPGNMTAALVLVLAWLIFVTVGTVRNATGPQPTWQPVTSAHTPPARLSPGIAYDTRLKQAVLFGGANRWDENGVWMGMDETWVWDGQDWVEQHPVASPPPRLDPAMAYDPKRGVVVLFGGQNLLVGLGDTWEWDGAQWVERDLPQHPQPRCCGRMVYDPARQKIVLFSGYAPDHTPPMMQNTFYTDAWEYDGQVWLEVKVNGIHPASNSTMVENPFQGGVLLADIEGIWNWSGSQMRMISQEIPPAGRYDPGLAYDPLHQAVILYGGETNSKESDETWRYAGSVWQRIYPARSPNMPEAPFRSRSMFFDQVRQQIILFTNRLDPAKGASTAETWGLTLP